MCADMLLFWGSGSPPCWRLQIALEEKEQRNVRSHLLSFEKKEHKNPEVLELNPRGELPTFRHGDVVVNESVAACLYLENCFKSKGTVLIPDVAAEQALVLQKMFEVFTLQQKMYDFLFYDYFVPEAERHDSALKRHKETLKAELDLWETHLQKMGKCSYIAGRSFTMADVVAFPNIAFLPRFGLKQERYPWLMEYYEMVKERPSVKATWPPHWLENPPSKDTLSDL